MTIDISSDDEEVGYDKTDGGCNSYNRSSGFLDQSGDGYDQVRVIGEVKPKKRCNYVDDECVILDGDPDNPMAEVNDSPRGGADELLVVGQKGQIACRDYPHPRSICAKFPFGSTPHERHCDMCHCYVCESPAPCARWGTGISSVDHCHATDIEAWKLLRRDFKGGEEMSPEFVSPLTPRSYPILDCQIPSITAVSVCSISTNPEIQRFRSQRLLQCCRSHSVSNLHPRSSSSHPKFKRAGSAGSASGHQSNWRAAHRSQYLRRHHPVSTMSHRNRSIRQVQYSDINSGSGTYLSSSPTNVGSFTGQRKPRRHHPVSRLSHRDHANWLPFRHPDTDSSDTNLDYLWGCHRGRWRQSHAGGHGKRYMHSKNKTQRAMDSRFSPFSSDYDGEFPPLPRPAESSVAEFEDRLMG